MSDVERTKGLMGTDDAMVWGEEFCRIFAGATIGEPQEGVNYNSAHRFVDVGTMVGWFANAMAVALDIDKARRRRLKEGYLAAGEPVPEAFVEGFEDGREGGVVDQ